MFQSFIFKEKKQMHRNLRKFNISKTENIQYRLLYYQLFGKVFLIFSHFEK